MNRRLKILILICSISVIVAGLSAVSFAAAITIPDDEYTVTTSAGPGGDITDPFTYTVDDDNTEYEVIYTSDIGYYIESVIINGEPQTSSYDAGIGGEQGVYYFTEGDQDIKVTFTPIASVNSKAGKISLEPDKKEIKRHDEVNMRIEFEPANTNAKSKYEINISDLKFISSDKGTLEDTIVSGTIKPGVKKETVNLKVQNSDATLEGVVIAELHNMGITGALTVRLFLISEEDMLPPPEDDIILDHSDLMDNPTYDEPSDEETIYEEILYLDPETKKILLYIAGVLALLGIAILIGIKRKNESKTLKRK